MNSFEATKPGLPPGLWLPTAEESTEPYLAENMRQRHREGELAFEDVVDYASFVVALAFYDAPNSGRVSMMPTNKDFGAMSTAGYGLNTEVLRRDWGDERWGGVRRIQKSLGFSPRDDEPTQEELMARFRWIVEHAYPTDSAQSKDSPEYILELLSWGTERDLTPSVPRVYQVFNGDTTILRQAVHIDRRVYPPPPSPPTTRLNLYRFGAKVIQENGYPLRSSELDEQYQDSFVDSASNEIHEAGGNYRRFWLEFDYVPKGTKLSPQETVALGVRWMIKNDGLMINTPIINNLSSEMRFPSIMSIHRNFDGIPNYQRQVGEAYAEFQQLEAELVAGGVSAKVVELVGRKFEVGPDFPAWAKENARYLTRLSNRGKKTRYLLGIMDQGFDLLNDDIFQMQLEDVVTILQGLTLGSEKAQKFVFDLIPRIDYDEVADEISKINQQAAAA